MGSGDTEVWHEFLESQFASDCFDTFKNEVIFDGFKGSNDEELSRLQNLQADVSGPGKGSILVYRYCVYKSWFEPYFRN